MLFPKLLVISIQSICFSSIYQAMALHGWEEGEMYDHWLGDKTPTFNTRTKKRRRFYLRIHTEN